MTSPEGPEGVADFRPTHVVPRDGLPAWEAPDVSRPTAALDAFLPVQLLSRRGEWAEILCANGWSAWVDGRLLVVVPQPPPTAGRPLSRAEDPRPLLARGVEALERYRRAADELASGRTDADGFRRATRGLRAGVVLDGAEIWLYDETAGRWMYGDGTRRATYAVVSEPGAAPGPQPPAETPESDGQAAADAPGRTPDGQAADAPAPGPTPGEQATAPEPTSGERAASAGDGPGEAPTGPGDGHEPTRIVDTPGDGGR
ncbi:hypothetical protein OG914_23220 [Streptomyces sp. NBC_00291]|uniref:hypothetical protein n=1 Tax=Streptomyces sp. NBC_00291 TaxID=2975704 RepID=UPI0022568A2C|nr:hypothetical protein [Streptomyces sp. NBC_00291]MCX5156897.1 hypothetical protein [Streptomyces sp. NBC_00291]